MKDALGNDVDARRAGKRKMATKKHVMRKDLLSQTKMQEGIGWPIKLHGQVFVCSGTSFMRHHVFSLLV